MGTESLMREAHVSLFTVFLILTNEGPRFFQKNSFYALGLLNFSDSEYSHMPISYEIAGTARQQRHSIIRKLLNVCYIFGSERENYEATALP